ncbi:MAG: hypothetical protein ABI851_14240 [Saprospiraceae bacterium]
MAKRTIIWSDQAQSDRNEILLYWIHRNKSKEYSVKLNTLIIRTIELLDGIGNSGIHWFANLSALDYFGRQYRTNQFRIFYFERNSQHIFGSLYYSRLLLVGDF